MIPRLLYPGINCLVEFSTIMWDNKLLLFLFQHQENPHFLNPNVKFFYLESMSVWGKKYKLHSSECQRLTLISFDHRSECEVALVLEYHTSRVVDLACPYHLMSAISSRSIEFSFSLSIRWNCTVDSVINIWLVGLICALF